MSFDPAPISEIASQNLDAIDAMVFTETHAIRKMHASACQRLGITPRPLTPVVIGMRSVTP